MSAQSSNTKGKAGQDDKVIGRNIKKYRLLRNLTQEQLADKIGITFQQLQKYEKGANRVTLGRVADISLALKVNLLSFFNGIDFFFKNDPKLIKGLAEQQQSDYKSAQQDNAPLKEDPFLDKKAIELIRNYAKIKDDKAKKQLIDLAKSLANVS